MHLKNSLNHLGGNYNKNLRVTDTAVGVTKEQLFKSYIKKRERVTEKWMRENERGMKDSLEQNKRGNLRIMS